MLACAPSSQQPRRSLHERLGRLLESVEWSDCTFRVGAKTIRAHRLILAASSPVFEAMLYGPMAEAAHADIVVEDVEARAFQQMLDFVYKDEVRLDSIESACALLYAAKKYMLAPLLDACVAHLAQALRVRNALFLLPFADWIEEERLATSCVDLVCKHARYLLAAEPRPRLSAGSLRRVLRRDRVNASERELVELALDWARAACGSSSTADERRNALVDAGLLALLRFRALAAEDAARLRALDVLTDAEKRAAEGLPREPGDDEDAGAKRIEAEAGARERVPVEWRPLRRPPIRSAGPLVVHEAFRTVVVRLMCRRTVFAGAVAVPSRQSPSDARLPLGRAYSENLRVAVYPLAEPERRTTAAFEERARYDSSYPTFVALPEAVVLHEDEWYAVEFEWPDLEGSDERYTYPLCYRPTTSDDDSFVFDDNFDATVPCGSFIEALKICE